MKSISIALVCASAIAVSGCAQKSTKIEAARVSTVGYERMSCTQLRTEAVQVSNRAAELTGKQNKTAQDDAVATGIALVLFWPAVFFVKGNKTQAAELARIKGELNAIEEVSAKKNCGIVFAKPTKT